MKLPRRLTILLPFVAWAGCFAVLGRDRTWLPFAYVGLALATTALVTKPALVRLLHPSLIRLCTGVLAGALMVALTHLAYGSLAADVPSVVPATQALFTLLDVTGFSRFERAALIMVIASCEEVLFRGPLLSVGTDARNWLANARRPTRKDFRQIFGSAAAYALVTVPLGSPLLVLCAFICGSIWGSLAVVTSSLAVPILTHVLWDLGVLLVWPVTVAHGP